MVGGLGVTFPLLAVGVFLLPTLAVSVLIGLYLLWRRRPQRRYWRGIAWAHALLLLAHAMLTFPLLMGWWGSRGVSTRGDERAWLGPRFEGEEWIVQRRRQLARAEDPGRVVEPEMIPCGDVRLRAFRVPQPAGLARPRAVVVLVHGLFRCALEVEDPARMFRRQGCEVWLVDQRNFGGSDRAPATFGIEESRDLVAVVQHVQKAEGNAGVPIVLFGVSLGTVSIAMALPHLPDVAGVVLDAPVVDFLATARRMMSGPRPGGRKSRFSIDEPFQSLVLLSLERWSGNDLQDVQPAAALCGLDSRLPVLLIAGENDTKVPAIEVGRLYDSLPMRTGTKELWVAEGAGHGDAWELRAADYERRLAEFVDRIAR